MKTGKILIGVIAGFATGTILGALFAPGKGSETRKKIASKGSESLEGIKDELSGAIAGLTEKLDAAKAEAGSLYVKGLYKVENYMNKAK